MPTCDDRISKYNPNLAVSLADAAGGGSHESVSDGSSADESPAAGISAPDHQLVTTLFDLGRQITSVLDVDDVLEQDPRLLSRLITFDAFAVYLQDERRGDLRVAYSVGYPRTEAPIHLKAGQGLVGAAVEAEQPVLVNDLDTGPRYLPIVPGMHSEVVVPLLHKSR